MEMFNLPESDGHTLCPMFQLTEFASFTKFKMLNVSGFEGFYKTAR